MSKSLNIALLTVTIVTLLGVFSQTITTADAQAATIEERQEKRLLDCNLESEDIDDCDITGYVVRVLIFSLPGLLIALGLFLVCPWYCCCKYCCNFCGGRHQSPNFCCPNNNLPARYSSGDIIRPKVLMLVCLLMAAASLIWSMIGTAALVGGVSDFALAITEVPAVLTTEIDNIGDALVIELFNTTTNTTDTERLFDTSGASLKAEAESARDDLQELIDDSLGNYQEQVDNVQNVLWAIFILPAVFIFLGAFFGCCNCRNYLPMTVVWFLFLTGFLIWTSHFTFSMMSFMAGDVCAEVSGLANKQLNLVSILAQCDDAQFSSFRTTFRELEISRAESTCNGVSELCFNDNNTVATNLQDGRIYSCPSPLICTGQTFATLVDLMETQIFTHPDIESNTVLPGIEDVKCRTSTAVAGSPCTIERCADDCLDNATSTYRTAIGQQSKELFVAFIAARTISNVIDTLGARYATCDSIMSIIIAPFDQPCQDVVTGFIIDRQASGLMGLACIAGLFIFAWGAKRFIPLSEAEKAQPIAGEEPPPEIVEG